MRIGRLAAVLVLLSVVVTAGAGYTRSRNQENPTGADGTNTPLVARNQPVIPDTHTVRSGDVEAAVSGLGALEPVESISLSFETGGRVEVVYVEEGDFVSPGDVLAELDNAAIEIEHEQALLAIDRAELDLLDLVEPVSEDDIALAQAAIDRTRAEYTAALTSLSPAAIQAAQLQYEQAVTEYNALQGARVYRSGGESEIALSEAEIGAASFNAEIARLNLENVRNGTTNTAPYVARVREAELSYEALFVGPSEYDLEAAEIRIDYAYADLYDVELRDSRTRLIATIAGQVGELNIAAGDPVNAGQPALEIVNRQPLQLVVQVDENDISRVAIGMDATVQLDALPDATVTARVSEIAMLSTLDDGVVSYDVTLDLLSDDPRIREGMTAEAFIQLDARQDVVVVPNTLLGRVTNGTAQLEVYDPITGEISTREITIGLRGQAQTEVVRGLAAGEQIVIEGEQ